MTLTTTIGETAGKELQRLRRKLKDNKTRTRRDESAPGYGNAENQLGQQSQTADSKSPHIDLGLSGQVEAASSQKARLLAEIRELEREKRWKDILSLAYPLEEKYPLLTDMEMDLEIRRRLGFALVRCSMHHKALKLLISVASRMEEDFLANYSVGYAAYDALYLHKNRQLSLSQKEKQALLDQAHSYFGKCARLRPDAVNAFYRRAMLYKELQDKTRKAIPLFERAIRNWDGLDQDEKEKRHQERPKFVRSLYHLASCFVRLSLPSRSLVLLERLMREDEATGFISPVFKHFAMGKTLYRLGRYKDALDHLRTAAAASEGGRPPDYVIELSAGCLLMMNQPEKALLEVDRISLKYMRPYVRWRRADILVALDRKLEALSTLEGALDRDGISRHKTLLRIARIRYSLGEYENGLSAARKAAVFYRQRYGNELLEASFLEAVCKLGMGQCHQARVLLEDLQRQGFSCAGFRQALLDAKAVCAEEEARTCNRNLIIH